MNHISRPQKLHKIGDYLLSQTLGAGYFGKVKLARNQQDGHKVAIKILNKIRLKKLEFQDKAYREIRYLKLFRHPHIIRLFEVLETPSDIYMIMEFVSGGELYKHIAQNGKICEIEARRLFQQIVSGVEYCHRHRIVHRDLKPENLLLDEKLNVKIADFGLSNLLMDGEFLKTSCGSPHYASPEIINGQLYAGPEVDVWSCGVILFTLLCGYQPFDADTIPLLYKRIRSGLFEEPDYLSNSARDLIKHMLTVDPICRATLEDVKNHLWFAKNLPSYLFSFPKSATSCEIVAPAGVDLSALEEVCREFGVGEETVREALKINDKDNEYVKAYELIMENLYIEKKINQMDNTSQYFATCPSTQRGLCPDAANCAIAGEQFKQHLQKAYDKQLLTSESDTKKKFLHPRSSQMSDDNHHEFSGNFPTGKTNWFVGIRSIKEPATIMLSVYQAMKTLDYEWKILDTYHVRVRKTLPHSSSRYVKICLRLYRVDKKNYLLDLQSLANEQHKFEIKSQLGKRRHRRTSSTSALATIHEDLSMLCIPKQNPNIMKSTSVPDDIKLSLNCDNNLDQQQPYRARFIETYPRPRQPHLVMEFFEMCTELIKQLNQQDEIKTTKIH